MKKKCVYFCAIIWMSCVFSSNAICTPIGPNWKPSWADNANYSSSWEQGTAQPIPISTDGVIRFELNNYHLDNYLKTVWFYMEYTMPIGSGFSTARGFSYNDGTTNGQSSFVSGGSTQLNGGLYSFTYIFTVNPQPDKEWVNVTTGILGTTPIDISYANMYSKCEPVPEPTTMALMGVGLLGLVVAVRRKNIPSDLPAK